MSVGLTGTGDTLPLRVLLDAVLGEGHPGHAAGQDPLRVDYDGTQVRVFRAQRELPTPEVTDVEISLSGTSFTLLDGTVKTPVLTPVIGERIVPLAVAALVVARESGLLLAMAIERLERVESIGSRRMSVSVRPDGATIINDAHDADYRETADALKTLAQLTRHGGRSIAVLGGFTATDADRVEQHDAIGRLIVRLNIAKLVAVGTQARHIQAAAGLEGSWSGESVIVANNERAYDFLRDEIRQGDVVLVKSAAENELGVLGDRLSGVTPW